jgi:hypothetical protein
MRLAAMLLPHNARSPTNTRKPFREGVIREHAY